MIERRQPFVIDEAKFGTQRVVTYFLLAVFAGVTVAVFWPGGDQSERSTMMQTVINFTMLAIGFWLGSSKGAADNRDALNKMLGPTPASPLKADDVQIDAKTATITTTEGKP